MISVKVSSALRRYCGNAAEIHGAGENVLEVLTEATVEFPELRRKIFSGPDRISPAVFIYRDENQMIMTDRENEPVEDGAMLRLCAFVGGG